MTKLADVKEGDRLVADGGFSCIKAGTKLTVAASGHNSLYVPCAAGRHFLNGAEDDEGNLVGFTKAVS